MTDNLEVAKWGHTVEVTKSPCGTCGQPVLHNLGWKVVTHSADAVDPCDAPWPDEPRPAYVTAIIEQQQADVEAMRRGAALLDVTVSAPALGVDGPRSEADVLRIAAEQADRRRARAEHAAVDIRPTDVSDLLRERLGRQVARRAADRGQLDVGNG